MIATGRRAIDAERRRLVALEDQVHLVDGDLVGESGSSSRICRVCWQVSQPSVCVKNTRRTGRSSQRTIAQPPLIRRRYQGYFKNSEFRISNSTEQVVESLPALVGPAVPVCRSIVVRGGDERIQLLRASLGVTRAVTGWVHSKRAPVSNETHCTQLWRSTPHRAQRSSAPTGNPRRFPHRGAAEDLVRRPSIFGVFGPSNT